MPQIDMILVENLLYYSCWVCVIFGALQLPLIIIMAEWVQLHIDSHDTKAWKETGRGWSSVVNKGSHYLLSSYSIISPQTKGVRPSDRICSISTWKPTSIVEPSCHQSYSAPSTLNDFLNVQWKWPICSTSATRRNSNILDRNRAYYSEVVSQSFVLFLVHVAS